MFQSPKTLGGWHKTQRNLNLLEKLLPLKSPKLHIFPLIKAIHLRNMVGTNRNDYVSSLILGNEQKVIY